ncbi:MAG: glycosyltransferase family 2 protein [Candidatus Competibacteraceae bacterium]|nr:MAG: glycosyltransferase family 2 protein [Candidatus Competibacteraceae bacterium]
MSRGDINPTGNPVVVVVTYNRKALLAHCLDALRHQTLAPAHIIVIDNASTDGTRETLAQAGWLDFPGFSYTRLDENTGGAGGFHAGLKLAAREHSGWVWLMDDDAIPEPTALEELARVAVDTANIYGSVALDGNRLSWRMSVRRAGLDAAREVYEHIRQPAALPDNPEVQFIPFLGFLIHTELVKHIGLPEQDFFIAADDVEYCVRARKQGAKIILATLSHLQHPTADDYSVKLFGQEILCLKLPPWKRYYDTRNRLLVARKHYGVEFYYKTIPGSLVRLFSVLWFEPRRLAQLRAFVAGFVDGLLGRQGRRHERWCIEK